MAPFAAMIAETPQTADPMAGSDISFGFSLNNLPKKVISAAKG
jgi:hypothetical protein